MSRKRSFADALAARRFPLGYTCNADRVRIYVTASPVYDTLEPCASATGGCPPPTRTSTPSGTRCGPLAATKSSSARPVASQTPVEMWSDALIDSTLPVLHAA
jgi:hypothetical protein